MKYNIIAKKAFLGYIGVNLTCSSIYGLIDGIKESNNVFFNKKSLNITEFTFEVIGYSYLTTSTVFVYSIFSPLFIPYVFYNKMN